MQKDLILEIGLEEVPARFMSDALEQLKNKAQKLLNDNRLKCKNLHTYGTPRRLTLYIEDLSSMQEDLIEEAKGPSKNVAYDSEGIPTKAAMGFAKSRGVDIKDLIIKEIDNGEYVFAQVKKEGKNTIEVLPQLFKELVFSLSFPKPMRWADYQMRFVRPIRWIMALFGDEIIPFSIEDVHSDRITYGHRFLSNGIIEINNPREYISKLEDEYVIVDPSKRKKIIADQIKELEQKEFGFVDKDNELLEEVNYLLEYPTALCGKFDEKFLNLPQEVLITPMKEHQRYFPVWDEDNKLLNKFVTVRNGSSDYLDIVTAGNENVLKARLEDAKFFYEEDIKIKLDEKVDKLKNVVFQEKLGTVYDKMLRIKDLTEYISQKLNSSSIVKENALRCAYLTKADLVTSMVFEFTELQGIMGYYYALHDGENEEICTGIREHYMPRYSGDNLPSTDVGKIVAIADKIDTITGCFAVGIQPTGSQDPYALRRQAQGICLIIKESNLDLSLKDIIVKAYKNYESSINLKLSEDEVINEMSIFLKQRLSNIMEEEGIKYDIVNSVLNVSWEKGADVFKRAKALSIFKEKQEFEALLTAFTRAGNLSKKAVKIEVKESLFEEGIEKKLWKEFLIVKEEASPLIEKGEYLKALSVISNLRDIIDEFFEEVMVMVENSRIKNNRLALLKNISDYMSNIADFSKINN